MLMEVVPVAYSSTAQVIGSGVGGSVSGGKTSGNLNVIYRHIAAIITGNYLAETNLDRTRISIQINCCQSILFGT